MKLTLLTELVVPTYSSRYSSIQVGSGEVALHIALALALAVVWTAIDAAWCIGFGILSLLLFVIELTLTLVFCCCFVCDRVGFGGV